MKPCGGAPGPTDTMPELIAAVQNDTCVPRLVLPIEGALPLELSARDARVVRIPVERAA